MNRPAGQSAKHRAQLFAAPVAETWQVLHDVPAPPPPAEEPSWDWKPQPVVVQAPVEVVAQRPVLTESVLAELTPAQSANAEPISQPFRFFQIDPAPAAPVVPSSSFVPKRPSNRWPKLIRNWGSARNRTCHRTTRPDAQVAGSLRSRWMAKRCGTCRDGTLNRSSHVELLERLAQASASAHRRAAQIRGARTRSGRHPMARVMRWRGSARCATLNSCRKAPLSASSTDTRRATAEIPFA
jgi:hypothetical protein